MRLLRNKVFWAINTRMKLGTIIVSVLILVGCGIATTQMMSVGVPNENIEEAKRKMAEAEKSARMERHYPAPMSVPPRPPPMSSREPIGGGSPPVIERRELYSVENKTDTVTRQLFSAALAFVIPEIANIDDTIKAQLLINPKKEVDKLKEELTKKGTVTGKEIKVSKVVKATLIAPDFDVAKITEEEQILSDSESTEWLWSLSPKSSGAHDVNLTVTAVITSDGKETKHQIKTFEKTITVNITAEQIIINWLEKYWQWIVSTLIIPFGIWLYKKKFAKS